MADATDAATPPSESQPPNRLRQVGPGLVMAATGVGVGDLVASIVAGEKFGYTFVWAFIFAAVLKYYLTEGIGRWHLVSGKTIIEGWRIIGTWAVAFVGVYLILWAFIFGAAGPSAVGLAGTAMWPVLSAKAWAVVHSVVACAITLIGRYGLFEQIMKALVGLMFVSVVGAALLVGPDFAAFGRGIVPTLPDESLLYAVGVVGGLGGSLALAAYGYWIRDKNWHGRGYVALMRLDCRLGYVATAIFALSVLVLGAEFLYGTGRSVNSNEGLIALVDPLAAEHGQLLKWLFLMGFWSVAFSSVLGVWNGMSYLFADIVANLRGSRGDAGEAVSLEKTWAYRLFVLMLTIPTIPLILLGSPVGLVQVWITLGAIFLPFLSGSLLYLLNARRLGVAAKTWSSSNVVLGISLIVFLVLLQQQLQSHL